jgi:subtilase family protein
LSGRIKMLPELFAGLHKARRPTNLILMNQHKPRGPLGISILFASLIGASALRAAASDLDTIGVTLLRQVDPSLTGSGVIAAQPEGTSTGNDFEVNPAFLGQPASLFTWASSSGTATIFPNTVGAESGHANVVGANFYGVTTGVAPQTAHVYNYEAGDFYGNTIDTPLLPSIPARVVNQSFVFSANEETTVDAAYDTYAVKHDTIFVSGVGNGGKVLPPGTCYNGIGAGLYGASSAVGPTPDGRSKPDIVAPDVAQAPFSANSFSIPYVAGSAVLLVQAALRGDGGPNIAAANDLRTIKALLLNGAVKPADWTNGLTTPLDGRYGAGVVNVFNSWHVLKGGQHPFIESTTNASGARHPPGANPANETALAGWDLNSITNPVVGLSYREKVNHYYFLLPGTDAYAVTVTLAWNWQSLGNNNLNLFLYDAVTSNLVMSSTSAVDNVEHIFLTSLPPGRYDLQVQKDPDAQASAGETYALVFEFFSQRLDGQPSGSNLILSWPVAPTGFRLVSTSNLTLPLAWTPVNASVTISNGQNTVTVPAGEASRFFRLQRP